MMDKALSRTSPLRSAVLIGLMLIGLLNPAFADDRETITLTNGEWAPYLSESFKYGGFLSRVCSEAFALEGVDVEYEYLPWKRAYESARAALPGGKRTKGSRISITAIPS